MNKIKRFFNRNRREIIKVGLIILAVIVLIQTLNYIAKIQKNTNNNDTGTLSSSNSIDYGYDEPIVSSENKSDTEYTNQKSIMQQFVDFCNNKEYENAYNLLTDECKEVIYPNINIFKVNYCDTYFPNKKTCGFQLWREDTYKVEIRDDLMSTGKYNEDSYVQEFFTVRNKKINIKGFIKKSEINKSGSNSNITIDINSIEYYIDYAITNITVKNMRDNTILLDEAKYNNKIVFVNNKDVEYNSYVTEMTEEELIINTKEAKKIAMKMNLSYRDDLKISKMEFKEILQSYEKYQEYGSSNRIKIDVYL